MITRYSYDRRHEATADFKLTLKSQEALEKFIWSELPYDAKDEGYARGRRRVFFVDADLAKAAGVHRYTRMMLDSLPALDLVNVAKFLGYSGPIEKVNQDRVVWHWRFKGKAACGQVVPPDSDYERMAPNEYYVTCPACKEVMRANEAARGPKPYDHTEWLRDQRSRSSD